MGRISMGHVCHYLDALISQIGQNSDAVHEGVFPKTIRAEGKSKHLIPQIRSVDSSYKIAPRFYVTSAAGGLEKGNS
jgi:hypothetical protein